MVQPNPEVIHTKCKAKVMEHGDFAPNDGNVALLVLHANLHMKTIDSAVRTT